MITLKLGDALEVLKTIPNSSIDCVVTSPPYYALRDYGHSKQIGTEATFEEYLDNLIAIFDQVRRVLRPSGTCWVNIGDSYGTGSGAGIRNGKQATNRNSRDNKGWIKHGKKAVKRYEKSLLMIPARFAMRMQARHWVLRQEIVWSKPNPMPESVKDRCTRSHEFIYMFVKQNKYFYDANAIKTISKDPNDDRGARQNVKRKPTALVNGIRSSGVYPMANKRSVWTINTKPYAGAHFAVFPEELCRDPIRAGCRKGGTVLDPFMGSGTVMAVARQEGRNSIGIELNPEYIKLAQRRLINYDKTSSNKK